MGFMYRRRGCIRHSVLGLQTFSNIVFALALITGLLSWATTTSAVTIGGPFALIAPDGTTVTEQTFRGKWHWFTSGIPLPQYLPDDTERNRHGTREVRY
jgi:protein SCO1